MSHLSISSRGLLMWDKIFAYWYSKLVTLPGEPHRHIVKIILVAHHILATRLSTHLYTVDILIFTSPVGEVGYFSWLETISMRTPLLDVAYNCGLLSILHSPIITLISLGFPSVLIHLRITSCFSYTALHSPTIKRSLPHHSKVRPNSYLFREFWCYCFA